MTVREVLPELAAAVLLGWLAMGVIVHAAHQYPHSWRGLAQYLVGVALFLLALVVAITARTGWT